jgi:hypothetical protein
MADVVQRFRRSVQTMGKLHKLANINANNCKILHVYMTKYSRHEDSQPTEAPVKMPIPEEIEADINSIADWLNDFNKNLPQITTTKLYEHTECPHRAWREICGSEDEKIKDTNPLTN